MIGGDIISEGNFSLQSYTPDPNLGQIKHVAYLNWLMGLPPSFSDNWISNDNTHINNN
jgi:hypothetical protein